MLRDIVDASLARLPDVDVHHDSLPDGVSADLVVEGSGDLSSDMTATVLISDDGRSLVALPFDQLSEAALALVVNSVRRRDRQWVTTVLLACRRIDALIEHATDVAAETYADDGDFADWRASWAAGRRVAGSAAPFGSDLASTSSDPDELLRQLHDGISGVGPDGAHPFAQLVAEYDLTGCDVDALLLCFVAELDPRYGQRYAYLQQDSSLTAPTIDLVAALLAPSASDRLDLQRQLSSGAVVAHGLVRLHPLRPGAPARTSPMSLDASVLHILSGDTAARPDQELIDPLATVRSASSYQPPQPARVAAATLADDRAVHFAGSDAANRRSLAFDLGSIRTQRVLVSSYADLATANEVGAPLDRMRVEEFRRELIRLGALGFIDGVPGDDARWQPILASARFITGGSAPVTALSDGSSSRRRSIAAERPRGTDRSMVWKSAVEWMDADIEGDLDSVISRFGVPVDRAVSALEAAGAGRGSITPADVITVLTESDVDSAGGLLTTARPRVALDDLVVAPATRRELEYACARIRHRDEVIMNQGWDQRSTRLTGTYLLFAGPSGTGKTMAAEAIAHEVGLPIQYLELSSLLSRWVGEFEKAIDAVFAAAEATGGIIAMNEADALLAPRTEVDNAQARYANAGTSHLLSRLEQFGGHVIFTTNMVGSDSVDPAFHRRLTATIRFRLPDAAERATLWRLVWPDVTSSGTSVHYSVGGQSVETSDLLAELADQHALSGGSIANIARNAAFLAAQHASPRQQYDRSGTRRVDIDAAIVDEALRLELGKIGDFRLLMQSQVAS